MSEKKKTNKNMLIVLIIIGIALLGVVTYLALQNMGGTGSEYSKYANDDYVKLGQYKGLEYKQDKIKVTDEEVEERINSELAAHATTSEEKEGTVKDGDTVVIKYEGKIDGKKFDGGSGDDYPLTIGSGTFIDGFESGLVGKKIGDNVQLKLKFPKDYTNKDLAGKDATFDVTIKAKQTTNTPKYDLNFIKKNTEYKTKEDYEKYIRDTLKKEKEESSVYTAKSSLLNDAVNNSEIKKYPEKLMKEQEDKMLLQYKDMAKQYNVSWDDFLKDYAKTTEKELKNTIKSSAESQVKTMLVCTAIGNKENISFSEKEYDKYLSELLKNAGMTEETFKEQYGKSIKDYAEENGFRDQQMQEKVMDFLYKNAKIK